VDEEVEIENPTDPAYAFSGYWSILYACYNYLKYFPFDRLIFCDLSYFSFMLADEHSPSPSPLCI